jgi:hypothetical protein
MNSRAKPKKWIVATGLIVAGLATDGHFDGLFLSLSPISDAEARIGRPATPLSYAGVARRTTRRVIRRSTIYVSTLPAACVRTTVNGIAVWRCGGAYYQAYGGRYVVVYID